MLSGDNGILQKATDAKELTGVGQEKEIVALAYNSALAKKVSNGDSSEVTADDLNTELTNQGASADGSNPITVIFTDSKRQYTINSSGTIEYAGTGNGEQKPTELTISLTISGESVETPPIPNGFYHVGGTKDTGFIISDNQADENKGTSHEVAQTLVGSQFVWVPVDKNQKITLKVDSKEDITEIKLYDPVGTEVSVGTVSGKTYNNTDLEPTYNGEYKAVVKTASTEQSKKLVVRSLYAQDAFNDYFTDEWYASEDCLNKWKVLTSTTTKEQLYETLGNLEDDAAFITFAKQNVYTTYTISGFSAPTENYSTSVNTYGGFYVGRYEGGNDNETLVSKANVDPYINVTRSQASELAEKMYETAGISHLLTGAAWDRTLGWLVNTNNKTLKQINAYSIEWGNYSDDGFSETTELAKTGEFSQTKANNIYDLAGNAYEWTSENSPESDSPCVYRGGCYSYSSAYEPASFRGINGENVYYPIKYGFRVALFL